MGLLIYLLNWGKEKFKGFFFSSATVIGFEQPITTSADVISSPNNCFLGPSPGRDLLSDCLEARIVDF